MKITLKIICIVMRKKSKSPRSLIRLPNATAVCIKDIQNQHYKINCCTQTHFVRRENFQLASQYSAANGAKNIRYEVSLKYWVFLSQ